VYQIILVHTLTMPQGPMEF